MCVMTNLVLFHIVTSCQISCMAIAMSEQGIQLLSAYPSSYTILHTRYVGCTIITLPLTIFMGKLDGAKYSS